MPTITRLTPIESIKPGDPPQVAPDGTILNPVPYSAVDIAFDDGVVVQVERPLTKAAVKAAYLAARQAQQATLDGLSTGQDPTV